MPFIGNIADLNDRLDMPLAEIGLSVRTQNCLEERGIFTVNDVLHNTRDDLLSIANFGEKTLEETYLALEPLGFYRDGRTPQTNGMTYQRHPEAAASPSQAADQHQS